jgi:hypothetical protein
MRRLVLPGVLIALVALFVVHRAFAAPRTITPSQFPTECVTGTQAQLLDGGTYNEMCVGAHVGHFKGMTYDPMVLTACPPGQVLQTGDAGVTMCVATLTVDGGGANISGGAQIDFVDAGEVATADLVIPNQTGGCTPADAGTGVAYWSCFVPVAAPTTATTCQCNFTGPPVAAQGSPSCNLDGGFPQAQVVVGVTNPVVCFDK